MRQPNCTNSSDKGKYILGGARLSAPLQWVLTYSAGNTERGTRSFSSAGREEMARWLLVNRQKNQDRHYLKQIYACAMDIEDRRAKLTKYTEFLIIWSSVIQMGKQHNWISDCRNWQRPGLAVEEEATPNFTRPPADFINIIIIGDHHYWKQPPISHPYGKCEPFLFSISGWIQEQEENLIQPKGDYWSPLFLRPSEWFIAGPANLDSRPFQPCSNDQIRPKAHLN